MPKTRSPSVLGSGRILYLPTARIRPNPMQPRKHFDTGGLQELAGSIVQVVYGMLRENSSLQREVSGICYQLAARGVMQAQEMLGSIAGDVLGTMTDEQINRLVYDKAEPDLLWIRMNGSIVGAAIGLVIFAVMQFI